MAGMTINIITSFHQYHNRDAIVVFLENYNVILPPEVEGFPVISHLSGSPTTFPLSYVKKVLTGHVERLMALPGMCAIGIGLLPNNPNNVGLIAFVDNDQNAQGTLHENFCLTYSHNSYTKGD